MHIFGTENERKWKGCLRVKERRACRPLMERVGDEDEKKVQDLNTIHVLFKGKEI